jgi:hypothetical protein
MKKSSFQNRKTPKIEKKSQKYLFLRGVGRRGVSESNPTKPSMCNPII